MKNRRRFIKQIGLTGLAATVFPVIKLSAEEETVQKTASCDLTTSDYYGTGPFYKAGAPLITGGLLASASEPGQRLIIKGNVYAQDCLTAVTGAKLDIWHASDAAVYDNVGFKLRGKLNVNSNGSYQYETIRPGKYLNGSQYRPSHIHLKVTAPGYNNLTTQLYFTGDTSIPGDAAASIVSGTYNATKRIISLTLNTTTNKWEGTFDIILKNPTLGVDEESLHLSFGLITSCYPNPVSNSGTIKFSVFKPSDVVLNLYSITGEFISVLHNKNMAAGKYEIDWNPQSMNIAAGLYIMALEINGLNVHHIKVQVQ